MSNANTATRAEFSNESITDEQLAAVVACREDGPFEWRAAEDAFEALYRRHASRLTSFLAARVHRNDLEDAAQVVWQRVWESIPGGFRGGCFRVWLFHISRNYVIDQSRRKKSIPIGDATVALVDEDGDAPSDRIEECERTALLTTLMERLGGQAAEVLELRLAGSDYDDICRRLSITKARAHKLLFRAKAFMTEALAGAPA